MDGGVMLRHHTARTSLSPRVSWRFVPSHNMGLAATAAVTKNNDVSSTSVKESGAGRAGLAERRQNGRRATKTRNEQRDKTATHQQHLLAGEHLDGIWRVFEVAVPLNQDPGKDDTSVHPALLAAVNRRLNLRQNEGLAASDLKLVRKAFDARPNFWRFVYIVDVADAAIRAASRQCPVPVPKKLEWLPAPALKTCGLQPSPLDLPLIAPAQDAPPGPALGAPAAPAALQVRGGGGATQSPDVEGRRLPVVVVGSGPAGLFAALEAARAGLPVVLLERGQPVGRRGRDIGALFVRQQLDPESNLCYGEGGAGTWSDGKLTTRIGHNSDPVRRVLQELVSFGAPEGILVAGKPHLGTDRLVHILKTFRQHLISLGVVIRFGTRVEDLVVERGRLAGVVLEGGEQLRASAVVLAVGHSARPIYRMLLRHDVALSAKSFAMGFRIEHPQALIDEIQYGMEGAKGVLRGKGKLPVADYTLATQVLDQTVLGHSRAGKDTAAGDARDAHATGGTGATALDGSLGQGSGGYGLSAMGGQGLWDAGERHVYSFCMCPGGQIVPTSTNASELCINGMSFSRRDSRWANAALVIAVQPHDWAHLAHEHGQLAGVALQEEVERAAAVLGGGNFVVPVQRVTDYMSGEMTPPDLLPSSSYRLGVRSAALHELYSPSLTQGLRRALKRFDRRLPGFISDAGLLHGAETRTSSAVRMERDAGCQSVSMAGLFPCGEGAGYAGGIVSAAVDGLRVGAAVTATLIGQGEGPL